MMLNNRAVSEDVPAPIWDRCLIQAAHHVPMMPAAVPKYFRLMQILRHAIAICPPSAHALPSVAVISSHTGYTGHTVRRALRQLAGSGLVRECENGWQKTPRSLAVE